MDTKPANTMIKFNIKSNVKVKLTFAGRGTLRRQHVEPIIDEDGYWHTQMYKLMEYFGDYMTRCMVLPFEATILLDTGEGRDI